MALMVAAPVAAQGPGEKGKPPAEKAKGKEKEQEGEKGREKEREKENSAGRDKEAEGLQRELRGYYEKGGAKPKDLPPGIERTRVPDGLAAKLPKRAGEEWAMFGNRLIAVDKAGVVKEIITP